MAGQGSGKRPGRPRAAARNSARGFASQRLPRKNDFSIGRRSFLAMASFAACSVVFTGKILFLQVIDDDRYLARAEATRERKYPVPAKRGTIYDRNGIVLATSTETRNVYADPRFVEDPAAVCAKLAQHLGGSVQEYEQLIRNPSSESFVYLKRQVDMAVVDTLKADLAELELTGVFYEQSYRRDYPNGQIAGQVVGVCDVDGNGITGLELQYNEQLKGKDGYYWGEVGYKGTPIPDGVIEETDAVDGADIMCTLDVKMQAAVEQALAEGCEKLDTKDGTAVLMDAATGEVYAICSLPYMDPNDLAHADRESPSIKAITQAYEPGSVFKTVSALTLLETGTMTPQSEIYCPETIDADEYTVKDSHDRPAATMTLREILNQSSNVGISLSVEKMGFRPLYNNILKFGLNEPTGIDYPGESKGYMAEFKNWSRIAGYNITFGQGISVTPLQLTRFYAMIANDGVATTPHLLLEYPKTQEMPEYETKTVVTDEEALANIKSMLRTVVTDGTGKVANIDGFDVCAKTSTAEIADPEKGGYKKEVYNLAYAGFIDNSTSKLVCFVGANNVYGMRQTGDIFKAIMTTAIDQYSITPE